MKNPQSRHPAPNVTNSCRLEQGDVEGRHFIKALIDTMREGLLILTPELTVEAANRSFYELFKVDPLETEGRRIFELGNGQWNIPELRRLLEEVVPENEMIHGFEVTLPFEGIGKRTTLLNARRLDHHGLILLVFEDTTEREEAEAALRELNETLEERVKVRTEALRRSERRFYGAFHAESVATCLATVDEERFLEVNAAFLSLTGYERNEVLGYTAEELGVWSFEEDRRKEEAQGKGFRDLEASIKTKTGETRAVRVSGETLELDSDRVTLKQFYTSTERKRSEEELAAAIHMVMQDATWFSRQVLEKLAQLRLKKVNPAEVADLTPRERVVLERIAAGINNQEISAELGLASQTVRNYTSTIYDKIGVRSRAEAVVWARERGLLSL